MAEPGPIIAIVALIALLLAPPLTAQVQVRGVVKTHGVIAPSGPTSLNQYTHIWAFQPPLTPTSDNGYFATVYSNTASIDGVSVTLSWSSIETSQPSTTPCVPSDVCQQDPGSPQMYHTYSWTNYDSHAAISPVYEWISVPNKKVNLLVAGESAAAVNTSTPWYVTSPWWYDQFNPQQQDVLNAVNASCSTVPWTGTPVTASYGSGTVTVTSTGCCSGGNQSATIQNGDMVWESSMSTGCGTGTTGAQATVLGSSTNTFTYSAPSCSSSSPAVSFISASESWAVPYELPYMSALQAFWAAVVVHYGHNFTLNSTNYYPQLNYFRFGGSVGSEWYPYCTATLAGLTNGYGYTMSGWTNYYQQMGNYLQSLGPPWRIIHSINSAENPVNYVYATTEAGYAVGWSNAFGVRDGFGSQGLSALDQYNCTAPNSCTSCLTGGLCSASDWYPLFTNYKSRGVPLELQPESLSYPGDTDCSSPVCGVGSGNYSGDLPTFLYPFATGGTAPYSTATDVEIYWRDLSLAYDPTNYCSILAGACNPGSSISLDNELASRAQQFDFFSGGSGITGVGVGDNPTSCNPNGTQGNGDCAYRTNVDNAHGQH